MIRFEDESRQLKIGEPCIGDADQLDALLKSNELCAIELKGDDHLKLEMTGKKFVFTNCSASWTRIMSLSSIPLTDVRAMSTGNFSVLSKELGAMV